MLLLAVSPGFAANPERSLPAFFIPNSGLVDPAVRYFVDTPEVRAGFTANSAIFQLPGQTVGVRFVDADPAAVVEGIRPWEAHANFLLGNRLEDWKTNLPVYRGIVYRNLYPGIDMTFGAAERYLKSEFVVAPGADPGRIRLEYSGDLSLTPSGDLLVRGAGAALREEAPVIYQHSAAGALVPVAGRYRLLNAHLAGFETGAYDPSLPLIIDPTLSYATYLGGGGSGAVQAVAVDSGGNLYAAGWTAALNFPIAGAFQATDRGGVDAFVVKLNALGSALVYATYVGGRGDDRAYGLAVDGSGQAYVTGSTASADFPLAAAAQSIFGGSRDAFALELNATGNRLLYSTYLGGLYVDQGNAIAVDSSGNAYIAGDTQSANFPVLGAAQSSTGGGFDAFVTKLNASGALVFSTYLGGSADEHAGGIAVDSSGNSYIGGGTLSSNFRVKVPIQASSGGSQDAFLAKFSASGSLVYSTYLGGSGGAPGSAEQINAVVVDSSGNAYVAGVTSSSNFPVTAGAFQRTYGGGEDAFAAKINPAGSALVYSTYFGGYSFDWASGLAVDSNGNAYLAGYTSSANLPVVSPLQAAFNGFYDTFVSELNATGSGLVFSTFYGGTGADQANAIALDTNKNIFLGGQTSSLDLPLQGPIQSSNIGGSVGWLARFGVAPPPPQLPSTVSVAPASGSGSAVTLTAQFSDPSGAAAITGASLLVNNSASPSFGCQVNYSSSVSGLTLTTDTGSGTTSVVLGSGNTQNSQCMLSGAGSSVSLSGTTLTITAALTFLPAFQSSKTTYLYAADANGNTGYVARGVWTVVLGPPQPSADSVAPNSGMGSSQTFTFVFSDTQNPGNITAMFMLFNTSLSFANACYISYDNTVGNIGLFSDNGASQTLKAVSSTQVLQNSQCQVGTTSATVSGLSNIITLSITFNAVFSGAKNVYMLANDGGVSTTGWVQRGTFTVAVPGVPTPVSVVPAAGTGPAQRFTFTVADQGGSGGINLVAMRFATSLSSPDNTCNLTWDRNLGVITLSYNIASHGVAYIVPGSSTTFANSQCGINGANSTVSIGPTSIAVTLDLAFNSSFSATQNIYLAVAEASGAQSAWVTVGTWTVTGGTPSAVSVSPSSGAGSHQTFVFTVSDSVLAYNLSGMYMLFTVGAPTNLANACYLTYTYFPARIGLFGDDGVTFSSKPVGYLTPLLNSQCSVGLTRAQLTGTILTMTIELTFSASFNGPKSVYLQANEPASNTGWVLRGSWTVQ